MSAAREQGRRYNAGMAKYNGVEQPSWVPTFLSRLEATGIISRACKESGVSSTLAYKHRSSNPEFSREWDAALEVAYDAMEGEMQRRAYTGFEEVTSVDGVETKRVRKYSDALAMYLMNGYRKRKFAQRTEVSGPDEGPIEIDEAKRASRLATLLGMAKTRRDDVDDLC